MDKDNELVLRRQGRGNELRVEIAGGRGGVFVPKGELLQVQAELAAAREQIAGLRGHLDAVVEIGEPEDGNHSQYACCGTYYGQEHTLANVPYCPWLLAKQYLEAHPQPATPPQDATGRADSPSEPR